jgi:hypothetical protein
VLTGVPSWPTTSSAHVGLAVVVAVDQHDGRERHPGAPSDQASGRTSPFEALERRARPRLDDRTTSAPASATTGAVLRVAVSLTAALLSSSQRSTPPRPAALTVSEPSR